MQDHQQQREREMDAIVTFSTCSTYSIPPGTPSAGRSGYDALLYYLTPELRTPLCKGDFPKVSTLEMYYHAVEQSLRHPHDPSKSPSYKGVLLNAEAQYWGTISLWDENKCP